MFRVPKVAMLVLVSTALLAHSAWVTGRAVAAVKLSVGIRGSGLTVEEWQERFKIFTKEHPEIQIEAIEFIDWNMQKALVRAAGGAGYDVIYSVIEQASSMVQEGLVMPLTQLIQNDTSESLKSFLVDVHPALMRMWQFGGIQFFLPNEWNPMVMYYHTGLFDSLGVQPPAQNWSWDDFVAAATKLTLDKNGDGTTDVWGTGYFTWWNPFNMAPWIFTAGGEILNSSWTESRMNSQAVVEAIEFVRKLFPSYKVMPPVERMGEYLPQHDEVATWGAGRWLVPIYQRLGWKEFDIRPWPRWRAVTTVIGGGGYGVGATTRHPKEAWEVVKWLVGKENSEYLTKRGDSVPSLKSVMVGQALLTPPPANGLLWLKVLDDIRLVPSPPNYMDIDRAFREELAPVWKGKASPQQTAQRIHERIQQSFAEAQRVRQDKAKAK